MDESPTYHDGMRRMQDRFDSRRLADRLDERLGRSAFSDEDRAFIASRTMFFLATADAHGHPDCSYKGGVAGFVRITGASELAFPNYDGNGMFRSLGNIVANPGVGLLFIDFESPRRASEPQWVTERRRATETDAPHRPSQRLPGPPGSTSATKSIDFHFGSGGT